MEEATFAGGCFWCTEAIFRRLRGVRNVVSGYSGGNTKNPNYDSVSLGDTNHAEAIQITFDPSIISFKTLVNIFFHLHDPTTLNRQGYDVGTQYRSAIFFHNKKQQQIAEQIKETIEKAKTYKNPIVTKIESFTNFYPAEDYHQNYYEKNKGSQYCSVIIDPKIQKLLKEYKNEIQQEN